MFASHAKRNFPDHLAPAAIAASAGGPEVGERIVSTDADRGQMVDFGGRPAADVAGAAVSREDLLALRLPAPTPRAAQLAPLTPAAGLDQSAAAETRAGYNHPSSRVGSTWCSARSTAIASAITASILFDVCRPPAWAIRAPRCVCLATAAAT